MSQLLNWNKNRRKKILLLYQNFSSDVSAWYRPNFLNHDAQWRYTTLYHSRRKPLILLLLKSWIGNFLLLILFYRYQILQSQICRNIRTRGQKNSLEGTFLLIRHSKYRAMLSKIHSYRMLFSRFCPLGNNSNIPTKQQQQKLLLR